MEISSVTTAVNPSATSDAELIERINNGDRTSFAILYERYFRRVYGFVAGRLSDRADTEETVQEVFINIFSSLESFRFEAPFAAWVLGVARRTVANRFKKKYHPTIPFEPEDEPDILAGSIQREPTPLEHYECWERINRLQAAAAHELSAVQLRLFVMHHLRHQSIREIARMTNKSEDAVKSNLYRTRKLLLAR
jgi:RNA polymerase sigma-70 factor (ECF subfamily)